MAYSDEKAQLLERLLAQVNADLRRIVPLVTDPAFVDSDVRDVVVRAEKTSRYATRPLAPGQAGYDFAFARAEAKARAEGEDFVVVEKDGGDTLVVMPKTRLLKERPFGLGERDVIYMAGGDAYTAAYKA